MSEIVDSVPSDFRPNVVYIATGDGKLEVVALDEFRKKSQFICPTGRSATWEETLTALKVSAMAGLYGVKWAIWWFWPKAGWVGIPTISAIVLSENDSQYDEVEMNKRWLKEHGQQYNFAMLQKDEALSFLDNLMTWQPRGSAQCPLPQPIASATVQRRDPLVFDLDGNSIQTRSDAYFDYNGNDFAVQTGWISPWDGFLVMDRNGNGTIDDGSELFSGYTLMSNGQRAHNGYEALGEFDVNHDGKIDAADPAYSKLMVWQDVNGDGISDSWELHTLSFYGIASINSPTSFPTAENTTNPDDQGNYLQVSGTYTKTDGTTGEMGLYSFAMYNVSGLHGQIGDKEGVGRHRCLLRI